MEARDVMVSPVVTVKPYSSVKEVAKTLVEMYQCCSCDRRQRELVGIVSEGDLMHRSEAGTERQRSSWLRLMAGMTCSLLITIQGTRAQNS